MITCDNKRTGHDFRISNVKEFSFQQSAFQAKNCKLIRFMFPANLAGTQVSVDEFSGTATTLLELPTEVWVGTSTGGLVMFDKKTSQFIQYKLARSSDSLRMPTKRTVLLTVEIVFGLQPVQK
jgi:hypothetical protein